MNGIRCIALAAILCIAGAARASDKLDSLKFKFEVQLDAVGSGRDKLDSSYEKALEEYEGRVKEGGDLTQVLAIRKELEQFRTGPSTVDPGAGRLAELRSIYEQNLEKQALKDEQERERLYRKYISTLNSLRSELTKAGQIEDAKAVAAETASSEKVLTIMREGEWVNLKSLTPTSTKSVYGRFDEWLGMEDPRTLGGKEYPASEFVFAHAPGEILYTFAKPISTFRATVALHDGVEKVGSVVFMVKTEEGIVFTSDRINTGTRSQVIDLTFKPTSTMTLITDPDGNPSNDHSIWFTPEVLVK